MSELTELNALPLGSIVRSLEAELSPFRRLSNTEKLDKESVLNVYRRFDEHFERRIDYVLWRISLVPHYAMQKRWLDQPESPFIAPGGNPLQEVGRMCAESEDPVVVWSTVGIAATVIDEPPRRRPFDGNYTALSAFADRLYGRLHYELDPLLDCRASCGVAAALFILAHQRFHYKAGFVISESECMDFVKQLERWFRVSDPHWVPGRKLDVSDVVAERKGQYRLRPGHNSYEFSLLTNTLARVRPMIGQSVKQVNPEALALLELAYQYSLTAWLTARSRRHDEALHQKKIGKVNSYRSWQKGRAAFLKELGCLWDASSAARDAGKYLESAKLLYMFYRLVPDHFVEDHVVAEQLRKRTVTIRYLKEVGLEVDPRFFQDDTAPEIQSVIRQKSLHARMLWNAGLGVPPVLAPPHDDGWTGFALRVLQDQQTHPAWATLLKAPDIPGGEHTPAGYLFTVIKGLADNGFPASPDTLTAAYRLALEYGYVRSAGKMLDRAVQQDDFPIDAELLMDFVHNVKRCTQLDPFGMRYERIAEWRDLIVKACLKLIGEYGPSDWLSADDRVWLHELLLNRTHVHHRSLSLENTRRLYQKSIGTYKVEALREFYDTEHNLLRRYPGIANTETIRVFCARYGTSELGAPVAISSIRLGGFVSLVGVGRHGTSAEDVVVGDLNAAIQRLQADSAHWFGMADIPVNEQICWPNEFRTMCRSIASVAATCDPDSKVIMLSCDWFVAQFPWQHLFQVEGFGYLIVIVPNFSSIVLDRRDQPQQRGLRLQLSTETDAAISEANDAVRRTVENVGWEEASVCIVVGHGSKASEGDLPSVRTGPRPEDQLAAPDDWMTVFDSRIVVLHCCHGGVPTPMVMQELGGLVGLASNLATESLLAPVAEVHPVAVAQLQSCLCSSGGSRELGVQYLQAIKNEPECSLYNLYGNPYETLAAAPAAASGGRPQK